MAKTILTRIAKRIQYFLGELPKKPPMPRITPHGGDP